MFTDHRTGLIGAAVGFIWGRLRRLRPAGAGAVAGRAVARARRAEHRHRLGRMNLDLLEAVDVLAIERVAERALEPRQVDPFLLGDQADRLARLAHQRRADDALDIAFSL